VEVDSLFSLLLPGSDRNRDDRMLGYDAAHLLARMLLDRGQMPVLECTYSRRQQRASLLQAFADTPDTPLWVVEVVVSPDDAVLRFQRRPQATDRHERLVHKRENPRAPSPSPSFWWTQPIAMAFLTLSQLLTLSSHSPGSDRWWFSLMILILAPALGLLAVVSHYWRSHGRADSDQ